VIIIFINLDNILYSELIPKYAVKENLILRKTIVVDEDIKKL